MRTGAALLLVPLLAACLFACGGGEEGGATVATDGAARQQEPGQPPGRESSSQSEPSEGREASQGGGGGGAEAEQPQGQISPRSRSFRAATAGTVLKGLPEYGAEAEGPARGQAQAVLSSYLGLVGAGNWARACEYVLPEYIRLLAGTLKSGTEGCASALQEAYELAGEASGPTFPDLSNPRIGSFRIEPFPEGRAAETGAEEAGFALLHGSNGRDYWISMTREDGKWKVTRPIPNLLG